MKNIYFRLLFALHLLFLTLGTLTSAFAQITPSQDSYTDTSKAATNFGAATTLGVASSTASLQNTYIQFDLSSVPAGYTSANVAKATLKLYVNSVTTAGTFNVDFVNGTWSEKAITSSLAPALGGTIASGVSLTTAKANDYVLIDVTSAVGEWLNGSQANDGIALVANSALSATFDSKENTTQSHPAELDIVFTSGGTITGVDTSSGSGLAGGGTIGTLNLSLQKTCSSKQVLQWNGSAWVCASAGTGTISGVTAGTALTGGGSSGTVTLNLDTTKVPQLNAPNTFTANQIIKGNMGVTGTITGSFSGDGTGLAHVNAAQLGGFPATVYPTVNLPNTFHATQAFSGNGLVMYAGDPGCGAGFAGIGFGQLSNCNNYALIGSLHDTFLNRPLGGTLHFRENNGDEMTISPGGNIMAIGNITATSFTGDGSKLSNIAALSANNGFFGFNFFQQATSFFGSNESAVIGDMGCGGNSVGITFQAINCGSYALLDYSGQTILNRVSGQSMSFREGNGSDQMTLLSGGGINLNPGSNQVIVSANGTQADYRNGLATVQVLNYTSDTNTQMFAALAPNNSDANCVILTSGDFVCSGSKSAVVPVDDGSRQVALYAVEAPENWFEDYGGGTLMNGSATVTLDPTFVQTVNTGESYRVFVTPNGDCKGLYVTQKTPTSFEVHELAGGQANIEFDYRIIAKRKGYENIRMADKTELIRGIKQAARERDAAATLPVARKH